MQPTAAASAIPAEFEVQAYRTVTRRLMPLLFLSYILAYVDRVNVGFAKLQMQQDLGMSDSVYGLGAGIFFVGYFFFEVPANIFLQKIGAKYWLGSIMALWGCVSAATMLVRSAGSFYTIRLLLGIVESGFFPGVILYLTFWYTRRHRAKMVALFMTAIPISGVLGGAVSGWILSRMSVFGGLRGWQWLFLLEGLPSVLVGLAAVLFLENGPRNAKWLTPQQKELLVKRLAEEEDSKRAEGHSSHRMSDAFRNPNVWFLCLVYFGFVMGSYGVSFWLPQIISETITKEPFRIGLLSIIPWGVGAIVMVLVGHHSDVTGERCWHIAIPGLLCAVAFALSAIPGISGAWGLTAITIANAGVLACVSTFWSLPTRFLSATAAAAGIAWINSVGNLAGYVSPFLVGKIRDATHSMAWALLLLAGSCLISSLIVFRFRRRESRAGFTSNS
jgi:sugar phosphate permease